MSASAAPVGNASNTIRSRLTAIRAARPTLPRDLGPLRGGRFPYINPSFLTFDLPSYPLPEYMHQHVTGTQMSTRVPIRCSSILSQSCQRVKVKKVLS
ncbi:hypothetical protein NITHO_5600002 [Nitrolancea hollandica Lb]|uniref:Uncharacterized protein n=1 Tax=Nitrolancea hollandica Lb TaxID=1129897 RepID=I4EM39_9BACT|nr:hypothetical protein NITHO_5600002 [Nitrolancea hollandica Lb]